MQVNMTQPGVNINFESYFEFFSILCQSQLMGISRTCALDTFVGWINDIKSDDTYKILKRFIIFYEEGRDSPSPEKLNNIVVEETGLEVICYVGIPGSQISDIIKLVNKIDDLMKE